MTEDFTCPLPFQQYDRIILGHGSGGRLTDTLIQTVFSKYLQSEGLAQRDDSARLTLPDGVKRVAVTTDSHIVSPLFFPGGDIGRLAVCGTVNDLLAVGAVPAWLTLGFILEEGLPIADLERVLASIQSDAAEAGVVVVAGDTKVVERGKGDGIFISSAGVGWIQEGFEPSGANAQAGDAVMLTGTIGNHGMAVLCARGELGFQSGIQSDVAPLTALVNALREGCPGAVHVLRDPTRGGLSTTLNEIAAQSNVTIELDEEKIPLDAEVESLCEMLGFDPLWVANEGKMIVIVAAAEAEQALQRIQSAPYGTRAAIIGRVLPAGNHPVTLKTRLGTHRLLDPLPGEMLPRIC